MSRYRLYPTSAQETVLRGHCAHARYVWNLAVEQHSHWHPGRKGAPGCGNRDPESRESQSRFRCRACGLQIHADVNAARNIAAGHPTHLPIPLHSRGGDGITRPVNREPQLLAS
jgi:hypothetical protein